MASVSFSVEVSVDERLAKYQKEANRNKKIKLESRTDTISELLQKAGF